MKHPSSFLLAIGFLLLGLCGQMAGRACAQVPAFDQGTAELWARDDGYSTARSLDALEGARSALLEARSAIDAALIEVDSAMVAVRATIPDWPQGPDLARNAETAGDPESDPSNETRFFPGLKAALRTSWEWLGQELGSRVAEWELTVAGTGFPGSEEPAIDTGSEPSDPLVVEDPAAELAIDEEPADDLFLDEEWAEDEAQTTPAEIDESAVATPAVAAPSEHVPAAEAEAEVVPAVASESGNMDVDAPPPSDPSEQTGENDSPEAPMLPVLPREEEGEDGMWWDGIPDAPWESGAAPERPAPEGELSDSDAPRSSDRCPLAH